MTELNSEQRIKDLEKANRILQKKLERAEQNLYSLEESRRRAEALLKTTIRELRDSQTTLEVRSQELQDALTDLRLMQTRLLMSEKMSALGVLVAGVAHEINNPVSFIYGNLSHASQYTQDLIALLELYQHHYPHPHPEIERLVRRIDLAFLLEDLPGVMHSMEIGAERIRDIVLSLRTFSRMDEAEWKTVDIHEGIDSTLVILAHRLKAQGNRPAIQVLKQYAPLPAIECYAGQLNQVFMNLIVNAIDALEEILTLRTNDDYLSQPNHAFQQLSNRVSQPLADTLPAACHISPDPVRSPSCDQIADALPASYIPTIQIQTRLIGDRVLIDISDNGTGIPEALQHRLFDPFFTTKPVGKGTGMGLSISYQIITERHGGQLNCTSRPGEGTTFTIELPLTLQ